MRTFRSKLTLSILLTLAFLCQVAPAQTFNIAPAIGTSWRYTETDVTTNANWINIGYIDSGWLVGPSGFSYETSANDVSHTAPPAGTLVRTALSNPANDPAAIARHARYFRRTFQWTNASTANASLQLRMRWDDSGIVYLNGQVVFNNTAATPPLGYIQYTRGAIGTGTEGIVDENATVDVSALLQPGDNVLAAEVHQVNATSSDIVFVCGATIILPFAPIIVDDTQLTNRVVLQSRPTSLIVIVDGSPTPTYQWFHNDTPIDPAVNPTATNSTLVISRMTSADAGDYRLVATNPSGIATSRTATLGYMDDLVAPKVVRATGHPGLNKITVEFDEVMDTNTALQTFGYSLSPSLNVSDVVVGPYGSSVILTVDPQAPNTVYTVTVSEVYDLALNSVTPPNDTAQFRSWVPNGGCSGVLFEAFTADAANVIGSLTNRPNYPNDPFERLFINHMHSRAAFPDNSHDNYGGRMRSLFIPLVSGNWRLYMSSDDPGEVWFNPAGSGPGSKMLVARETACCNLYQAPGAIQTSPSFPLIAGQAYYLEMIYKEGGGGDYGMVAARIDNTGIPTGGNDQGAEAGEAIDGTAAASPFCTVGAAALPAGAAGSFSIVQNLSNVSVEANTRHTFTLGVSAPNAPYSCFQWQKSDDGGATFNNIPGANRASYTTPYLTVDDDNQDIYRVVVGIPGAELTSANSVLSVTADVTRPRITRVIGISTTQIAVYFSEPMVGPTTASDPFAYEVDQGISVGSAAQNPGNILRYDLTVATPMTLDTVYELRASTDLTPLLDGSGNVINPDPTRISFRAQNYSGNPDSLIVLPTNTKRALGSLTARGMSGRMVQILRTITPPMLPITEQVLAGLIDPSTGQPWPNLAPLPTFIETDTINYGDTPAGAGTGHLLPDRPFPGYTAAADNMVMEVLAYLELRSGIYRMGVNSDDDFQVTPAKGVGDANNSIVLGSFSGGRAPADSMFDFLVPEDGLYPFRLIWNEYQGGATCEWWIQSLADNSFIGVNGDDTIKAFLPPAVPAIAVTRGTGDITLSWTDPDGAYRLQQSSSLSTPSWSNLSGATGVGGNYSITITLPSSGERYYRLSNP
jgi:Ig-like domain-containing protein/Big-like domain-containing protein